MDTKKYEVSEIDRKVDIEKKKTLLYIDTLKRMKGNPNIKNPQIEFTQFQKEAEKYYDFHIKSRVL